MRDNAICSDERDSSSVESAKNRASEKYDPNEIV